MKDLSSGGVVLTFDDNNNIDSWHNEIDLFNEFDAMATFFINAPGQINDSQWSQLKDLAKLGHDVGCHGWRHEKAVDYCDAHGLKAWVDDDVLPADRLLRDKGFYTTSFAYPCSQRNQETDDALKQYFHHARTGIGLLEGQNFYELNEIYIPIEKVSSSFLLPGKSIDRLTDLSQIEGAFERVAVQSEIVVLYGHRIGTDEEGMNFKNLTYKNFLRKVMELARAKNLEFYTFKDLPLSI